MTAKRFNLSVVFCLCLVPLVAFSQNNSDGRGNTKKTEAIRNEILHLEDVGRQKALRGDSVWDDLMAENAYMIAYNGTILVYKKSQSLPSLPLKSFVLSEMIVRVYGDEVVVTGLATVGAETPDKKPYSFQMRFLNVWKKFPGGWKIIVSEKTGVKQSTK